MNTADRITLVRQGKPVYNPDTGEHEVKNKTELVVSANVNHLGMDRTVELFGDYSVEVYIVRFDYKSSFEYDYVLYKGKSFRVIQVRQNGTVLYIERDEHVES